jgi:hypothetical protein
LSRWESAGARVGDLAVLETPPGRTANPSLCWSEEMPSKDTELVKAAQRFAEGLEQPADPVTIEEAFNILAPAMNPLAAAARLNSAIVTGDAHLWGNGEKIHENFDFERHLRIAAKKKEGDHWTAEMELRWGVDDCSTTTWTMSRAEVTGLLKETEPQKVGRKRGAKVKFDWDAMVAEVIRRVHEEGVPDNDRDFANKLFKWALDEFEDTPANDTIRKKAAIWFSRLRLGN